MRILLLMIIAISCLGQKEQPKQVLRITNEKVCMILNEFTKLNTYPDVIECTKDGNGNWIVGPEVLQDLKFTFNRAAKGETKMTLETKLNAEVREEFPNEKSFQQLAELIQQYSELVDYVPIPDSLIDGVPIKIDTVKTNKLR